MEMITIAESSENADSRSIPPNHIRFVITKSTHQRRNVNCWAAFHGKLWGKLPSLKTRISKLLFVELQVGGYGLEVWERGFQFVLVPW